jgi:HlyD family secretion protein
MPIYLSKKEWCLKPGMTASVEIQTEIAKDVIAVPIESVTVRNKEALDTTNTEASVTKTTESTKNDLEVVFVNNSR